LKTSVDGTNTFVGCNSQRWSILTVPLFKHIVLLKANQFVGLK